MNNRIAAIGMALLLGACSSGGDEAGASAGDANPWTAQAGAASGQTPAPEQTNGEDGAEDGTQDPRHPAADPPRQQAGFNTCGHMFPGGVAPRIVNTSYASVVTPTYDELCYRSFAIGHSGYTRTAIWVSEVLDPQKIEMASRIERDSSFSADDRLAPDRRSELDDYRGSGYDRGHLAPSADMPSRESQQESFRLSNIVPQDGSMNGGTWRELEMDVRREARRRKVYVVTGPIFENADKALRKRVLVPTSLYKAMFSVDKGAVVYVVSNDRSARVRMLSLEQFATVYGIDPFPALTGLVRSHNIGLSPIPEEAVNGDGGGEGAGSGAGAPSEGCRQFEDEGGNWINEDFYKMTYGNRAPKSIRPCPGR